MIHLKLVIMDPSSNTSTKVARPPTAMPTHMETLSTMPRVECMPWSGEAMSFKSGTGNRVTSPRTLPLASLSQAAGEFLLLPPHRAPVLSTTSSKTIMSSSTLISVDHGLDRLISGRILDVMTMFSTPLVPVTLLPTQTSTRMRTGLLTA